MGSSGDRRRSCGGMSPKCDRSSLMCESRGQYSPEIHRRVVIGCTFNRLPRSTLSSSGERPNASASCFHTARRATFTCSSERSEKPWSSSKRCATKLVSTESFMVQQQTVYRKSPDGRENIIDTGVEHCYNEIQYRRFSMSDSEARLIPVPLATDRLNLEPLSL